VRRERVAAPSIDHSIRRLSATDTDAVLSAISRESACATAISVGDGLPDIGL
jgi:hypothetical protein